MFIQDFKQESKESVIQYLEENGIQSRPIWGLINEQIPYLNHQTNQTTCASYYWERILNLPCSSNLSAEDVEYVVSTLLAHKGLNS